MPCWDVSSCFCDAFLALYEVRFDVILKRNLLNKRYVLDT